MTIATSEALHHTMTFRLLAHGARLRGMGVKLATGARLTVAHTDEGVSSHGNTRIR